MQTADSIINSALIRYRVEVIMRGRPGSWARTFIMAADKPSARIAAKPWADAFATRYSDKRYRIEIYRHKL